MAEECALHNTVIASAATSHSYLQAARLMAQGAVAVGFPCVAVAVPASLSAAMSFPLVELQLGGAARWLPPASWCRSRRSGWRQSHVLKTAAMLALLERGRDALLIDADWSFVGNPLTALRATRADVAAMRDEALLNVGLLYMRASARTAALARRVANRTFAAWDQAVFHEELAAATGVSCCFTNSFIRRCLTKVEMTHRLRFSDATAQQEMQPGCSDSSAPPYAAGPPDGVGGARLYRGWRHDRYNEVTPRDYRFSRCTTRPCPAAPIGDDPKVPDARACLASAARMGADGTAQDDEADGSSPRGGSIRAVAARAAWSHGGTATADARLRCTTWPPGGLRGESDAARCARGNALGDGYAYFHNRGRGTAGALCGPCACCRQRRRSRNESSGLGRGVGVPGSS